MSQTARRGSSVGAGLVLVGIWMTGCSDDSSNDGAAVEGRLDSGSESDGGASTSTLTTSESRASDTASEEQGPGGRGDAGTDGESTADIDLMLGNQNMMRDAGAGVDAASVEPPADTEPTAALDAGDGTATTAATTAPLLDGGALDTTSQGSTTDSATGSEPTKDPRLGCGSDLTNATEVSGNQPDGTTWSGVVHIQSAVDLNSGRTLTIEPGTQIVLAADADINFGPGTAAATVFANGTLEQPIVFCGEQPQAGFWQQLRVGSGVTTNSSFSHVRVFDAGGDVQLAALEVSAAVLLNDVSVYNSKTAGVLASTFGLTSEGLSVIDSAQAVILTTPEAVDRFPLGGQLTENEEALARLRFDNYGQMVTFHNLGIPYLQEDDVLVTNGATMRVEAGVEYQFAVDTALTVGWNSGTVTWEVNGTAAEPVVFRGQVGQPGFWGGIEVGINVTSTSHVDHMQVWHGGESDRYALDVAAPFEMNDVTLQDNQKGALVQQNGLTDGLVNWTISGTGASPLTVHPNALTRIPTGGSYTGNAVDEITITDGSNSSVGTIRDFGVPYHVDSSWDTHTGSNLVFAPGLRFIMDPDTKITFGWNSQTVAMSIVGSEAQPIQFYGATSPFAGLWQGLEIGVNVETGAQMAWVELSDAGGGTVSRPAALIVNKNVFPVSNCTFTDYTNYAIVKSNSNTSDYSGNTFMPGSGAATDGPIYPPG